MRITEIRCGAAVLAALAVGAAACAPAAEHDDGSLAVFVSFAPLEYLVQRVAGPDVEVTNLTPPGADPHHHELSPSTLADLAAADLAVIVSGLAPATDEAIEQAAPGVVVDTLEAATAQVPDGGPPPDPADDPHFWLDPVRYGLAAQLVADALTELDPSHGAEYRNRAADLIADLTELDIDYRQTLEPCAGATLVTSHEAFGYLAARYQLRQEGISGIDPEVEPSPARLREVRHIVEESGARTIFFETAADPGVAQGLAEDLGIATAVLDPMERQSEPNYLNAARGNLAALVEGLSCG